jgi:outer membrane murein-binding lipoprotein Lpp
MHNHRLNHLYYLQCGVATRVVWCCFFAFTSGFSGCASQTQLTKLQQEKQQLTALVAQEKQRTSTLINEIQSLTDRTAEAERELALLHEGRPSAIPALASTRKATTASASFELWAKTHEPLQYDASRRVARVAMDAQFTGENRLSFQSRRELDSVADLLLTPESRPVSVRVVHFPTAENETVSQQQANAVLDYLKQRGVSHQRLEVVARPTAGSRFDEEGRKSPSSTSNMELELWETNNRPTQNVAQDASEGDGWVASPQRRR